MKDGRRFLQAGLVWAAPLGGFGWVYLAGGVLGPSSPCRVPLAGFLGNARFSSLEGGNFVRIPFPVARAFTCPRSPPFGGCGCLGEHFDDYLQG